MTAAILSRDAGFRRWLAARPGLWLEVGALDDAVSLLALMGERRLLGLPPIAALRAAQSRHRLPRNMAAPAHPRVANILSGGHP